MESISLLNVTEDIFFKWICSPSEAPVTNPPVPQLPSELVQKRFNGKAGQKNLEQALSFYRFIKSHTDPTDAKIMDFGSGWGRHVRFFLRDTTPEKIWAIDPLPEAHELMQSCNLSCNQVQSEVFPPITLSESESFDIIYAHSVFSHLEEGLASSWLRYLESLLAPGGVFIFTTRGRKHINFLKKTWAPEKVRGVYGDLATIQSLLNKGEFVFCRNRSENADFSGQWFGEAFIPKQYVENFFGKERVSYTEEVPLIPQAVFVIRKP